MANDIKINLDLSGEQRTNKGLRDTSDNLEKAGKSAERAGKGLGEMAKDAEVLDSRIGGLRDSVKDLQVELGKAGGNQAGLAAFSVGGGKSAIKETLAAVAEQGVKTGQKFGEGLTDSLRNLKGPAAAAAVGIGAAMAPFLGGVIASAVLGGAGAGGIAGGVALAAQDQRVKDAASRLGKTLLGDLQATAEPFLGPVVESLRILGESGKTVTAQLGQGFATLAPVLVPLTKGLSGLVENTMPGLLKAFDSAKPVLRAVGNELPKIGTALSKFFATIAEDPDGAIMAFRTLSDLIQMTIIGTGAFIADLGDAYAWSVKAAIEISKVMETLYGWIPIVGDLIRGGRAQAEGTLVDLERAKNATNDYAYGLDGAAKSQEQLARETAAAKQEITEMQKAMDEFFGITMNMHEATINYERAVDDLADTVKENGRTLDVRTEKGRSNRSAILDEISAIKELRDATIDQTGDVEGANAVYDQQLERLREAAIKLGLNKDQVHELIDAYKNLPTLAESEVRVNGLANAIKGMRELARLLGSATMSGGILGATGSPLDVVERRASGGPVEPHKIYRVNETGVEYLMTGSQGGYVLNANQTRAMMSGASGGAQWGGQPVVVIRTGDARLDALLELLDLRVEMALDREATLAGAGPR